MYCKQVALGSPVHHVATSSSQRDQVAGYEPQECPTLGPVDSHDVATTPATGRAPPRSSRRSCHGASRSPAAPRSSRGNSPPGAASRTSPGHGPGAPSGSAATGSPPPPRVPPDPPAASPRRTPCRQRKPRTQGRREAPAPPPVHGTG